MSQRDKHRPLCIPYTEFTLQAANDIFSFHILTRRKELRYDGDLFSLGLGR